MIKKIKNLVSILSILNTNNHSVEWWAFNFTSKNPYNTLFFEKILFKKKYPIYKFSLCYNIFLFLKNVIKSVFLLSQTFFYYLTLKKHTNLNNTLIFSYVDGRPRKNGDTYFGNLIDLINNSKLKINAGYLFYVYRPYFKNSKAIFNEKNDYHNIFCYLKPYDFVWCFVNIFKIPFIKIDLTNIDSKINIKKIINSQMISEISSGYIDNLIIYRAFKRLSNEDGFDRLIYPFENKSLEKLMLLEINAKTKTIGYQHSSITPSHFSLTLTKEERLINPLPDIIVTIGEITKNWLINNGKIPKEKIKTGVYLRGVNKIKHKKYFPADSASLLFVFSSSHDEIINTINFLKNGIHHLKSNKIVFRFHPDFPFKKINNKHKNWINKNSISISENSLHEDLKFCDVLVYISSSIAIEAISSKIPIINLDIGKYNSDPLLNKKLKFKRNVSNVKELVNSLQEFSELNKLNNKKHYEESSNYINRYAINKSNLNIEIFI